jgi:hypothetical protein
VEELDHPAASDQALEDAEHLASREPGFERQRLEGGWAGEAAERRNDGPVAFALPVAPLAFLAGRRYRTLGLAAVAVARRADS